MSGSFANATADHNPTVTAKVGSKADILSTGPGATVEIIASHNYAGNNPITNAGALAGASNVSAGLAALASSTVRATRTPRSWPRSAHPPVSGSTQGTLSLLSKSSNTASAALSTVSAGLVSIRTGSATPSATGSTTTNWYGSVGDATTAGAATLNVFAVGYTAADSALNSAGGGAVDVSAGSATASATPALTVNFGQSSAGVRVSGNITIDGSQTTDADAKANGASGGLIKVSSFTSSATATPTVTRNINDTGAVVAGGTLTIHAQHNGPPVDISDGTVGSATPATLTRATPLAGQQLRQLHQDPQVRGRSGRHLRGGDAQPARRRPRLQRHRPGRDHGLPGSPVRGRRVDTLTDSIEFGVTRPGLRFIPSEHNLRTGDEVYYFTGGGTPVAPLQSGQKYVVFRVDATGSSSRPSARRPRR